MDEKETITLYDEDGQETEFEVLGVVNVEDNDYAILVPLDESESEDEEAYIFRIDADENGEEVLTEVEDDDEFEAVREAWEAICEGDYDIEDISDDDEEEDIEEDIDDEDE
ncbi:MAG: hypothetical protein PWR06_1968 [Thermoanaerobacteraceae bacterium]|uniref:UPF0473 protein D2962_09005 n=1 Tax=Biomaibacter acetigenes TaxID=2316383 RepID=A0A3G2R5K1_9FIRM|nr:DUF1292 domain-containing protein [Biomaibacter acetigenes]AYO30736.1 DUF1292 domain-containing protein [Biomaibacter acetigenes]MDK2879252.1 hypothetical protein [Thermoanaerobacteraceae bacterium]MDN5311357.1 hypothetical protein [Thermoanaerobacteraceae bacterium]RKL64256.1 DUF1292 domain-containing protein [Thermoanaerobacteraceae bacterium SP2]